MPLLPFLHRLVERRDLTESEAREAMAAILSGATPHTVVAAFVTALRMKGETAEELTGFAEAMRDVAQPVPVADGAHRLVDTCGTGGDGASTFNISTLAAFVIAGAGVRVAKHGNRSISSRCGSADLMESLGIRVSLTPEQMGLAIDRVGIGFLFAPAIHTAMRHVQPVRVDLKMRTVFNLLGPLTNPAGAQAQVAGVPSATIAELIARALAALGLEHGFVVHGSDGLDEITTTGPTEAWEVRRGEVHKRRLLPSDFGVEAATLAQLQCPDLEGHKVAATSILEGETGPRRDIVLVNAAAALVAAGAAENFLDGMDLARKSLDSGAALDRCRALADFTQSL